MRQYLWVWLIIALVMMAPMAVILFMRGGDASHGLGLGFLIGVGLTMLDRELAARRRANPR